MIKRLASQLVRWAISYDHDQKDYPEPRKYHTATLKSSSDIDLPSPLRFKVQSATGGTIVEVTHYDRKRDENHVNLHIIPTNTDDIAGEIGRIVTFELMKA